MKYIISLLFLAMLLSSCSQTPDCYRLRTGIFETEIESVGKVVGERTDSTYIESIPSLGKKTTHTIRWKGDCTFMIEYLSGDLPEGSNAQKPISCSIIEVGEGYHVIRSRILGTRTTQDYRMVEVKN